MSLVRRVSRRLFLADLGRGALAVAVVGIGGVACSDDDDDADDSTATAPAGSFTPTATAGSATGTPGGSSNGDEAEATPTAIADTPSVDDGGLPGGWTRVPLGIVSAYVLARNGEAAVVDTGVGGRARDIEDALAAADLGWGAVGHIILTHSHGDHIGSLAEVMGLAEDATAYAGAGDIAAISSPRPLLAVADGDRVFELEIIETPGHTPGHVSVLDPAGGLLVAGDALNGEAGGVIGPNAQFTADLQVANASVVKLAGHSFDSVVFGHGDPVVGEASAQVAALAARL